MQRRPAPKAKATAEFERTNGSGSSSSDFTGTLPNRTALITGALLVVVLSGALAIVLRDASLLRRDLEQLKTELYEERAARATAEALHAKYAAMQPRTDNLPWQEELQVLRKRREVHENSDEFVNALFDTPGRRFPNGANTSDWNDFLRKHTPKAFDAVAEEEDAEPDQTAPDFCRELSGIVITEKDLVTDGQGLLSEEVRARALRSLTECGYVYLDNIISRAKVDEIREAYMAFRQTDEAKDFVYPVQGQQRYEHMLPFRAPFNDSSIYAEPRLMQILADYFTQEQFKMELMTVITSQPGSLDQRWHQGWRYLFHPDERLPPYAAVVALPLSDVTPEMGPTEMCPGKKLRFYHGYRCQDQLRVASTAGTIAIFDFKTLHRGPGNAHPSAERPMISMVFSRMFFMNTEAIVNRGISLLQTLHQRRYLEQFTWHPSSRDDQFAV